MEDQGQHPFMRAKLIVELLEAGLYPSDIFFEWGPLREYTFGGLRHMLEPIPKRGRVNKILRREFFTRNEKGYWERKALAIEYCTDIPSRPHFFATVLPLLIVRLAEIYGDRHHLRKTW
jgi:hypothetical protein